MKQPGLGGGSEMLHSPARGRMEKLVQTCLPDLEQRGGERERERRRGEKEKELSLMIDF